MLYKYINEKNHTYTYKANIKVPIIDDKKNIQLEKFIIVIL